MSNRTYDGLRTIVEQHGGSMVYEREGYRDGAWIIRLGEKCVIFEAEGNQAFSQLDRLYKPLIPEASHFDEFSNELVPDAENRLISLINNFDKENDFQNSDLTNLSKIIERTGWKFAWTYARTYPHEYTTETLCSTEDHAKLIDCIERFGVSERFGDTYRKYFYFEERKYWHMGDPQSENPDNWPNVINRTWVDVRRHAENVKHSWTVEEVELQARLWEIQLEKSTDRKKSR